MFCAWAATQVASNTNRSTTGELRIFLTICLHSEFWLSSHTIAVAVSSLLEPLELLPGQFILDISGVQRCCRLEKQYVCLFVGYGTVLNSARDNAELTCFPPNFTRSVLGATVSGFAKLHAKSALDHQKHLILRFVMMPGEWALKLHKL